MTSVVLDASAILAVMHRETGYRKVASHLEGSLVSAVNYAEVLKKVIENGTELLTARLLLQNLAFDIVPFDHRHALESARLWPLTRGKGLSFADRACLALGGLKNATVVTGDSAWGELELPLNIMLFR